MTGLSVNLGGLGWPGTLMLLATVAVIHPLEGPVATPKRTPDPVGAPR
ncbi:hypothetical protein [Streptomyces sp. NPDC059564]